MTQTKSLLIFYSEAFRWLHFKEWKLSYKQNHLYIFRFLMQVLKCWHYYRCVDVFSDDGERRILNVFSGFWNLVFHAWRAEWFFLWCHTHFNYCFTSTATKERCFSWNLSTAVLMFVHRLYLGSSIVGRYRSCVSAGFQTMRRSLLRCSIVWTKPR